jgi:hypothetical protein
MRNRSGIDMASVVDSVFLLWHVHQVNDKDEEKLIGVYRTEHDAKAAIQRLAKKPGFMLTPEGFQYDRYEVNRDHWTEGFVQV